MGEVFSDTAVVTTPFWLRPFNAFSIKIKSDISTWHSRLLAINTRSHYMQPPLPKTLQLSRAVCNLSHSPRRLCSLPLPYLSTASLALEQQVKAIRSDLLSHSWPSVPHSRWLFSSFQQPLGPCFGDGEMSEAGDSTRAKSGQSSEAGRSQLLLPAATPTLSPTPCTCLLTFLPPVVSHFHTPKPGAWLGARPGAGETAAVWVASTPLQLSERNTRTKSP